jgi:hypothetical protein
MKSCMRFCPRKCLGVDSPRGIPRGESSVAANRKITWGIPRVDAITQPDRRHTPSPLIGHWLQKILTSLAPFMKVRFWRKFHNSYAMRTFPDLLHIWQNFLDWKRGRPKASTCTGQHNTKNAYMHPHLESNSNLLSQCSKAQAPRHTPLHTPLHSCAPPSLLTDIPTTFKPF